MALPAAQALLAVSEALASGAHPDFIDAAARAAQARWSRRFGSATGTRDALEAGAAWGLSTEQMLGMREAIGQVDAEDVAGVLQDCVGHEVVTAVGRNAFVRLTEAGLSPESVDWRRIGAEVVDSLE